MPRKTNSVASKATILVHKEGKYCDWVTGFQRQIPYTNGVPRAGRAHSQSIIRPQTVQRQGEIWLSRPSRPLFARVQRTDYCCMQTVIKVTIANGRSDRKEC